MLLRDLLKLFMNNKINEKKKTKKFVQQPKGKKINLKC